MEAKIALFTTNIADILLAYAPRFAIGILVLLLGLKSVDLITRGIDKVMAYRNVDPSLSTFLHSLFSISAKLLVLIIVAGMLGVQTTSLVALLGAIGLAIGMALSGTLQNFAGGIIILMFKPFQVGDAIESQGVTGTVREIQIFNTILHTPDNKVIIIPNAQLSNSTVINYSQLPLRRVDLLISISHQSDITLARQSILQIVTQAPLRVPDQPIAVQVDNLTESAVTIVIRAWCKK